MSLSQPGFTHHRVAVDNAAISLTPLRSVRYWEIGEHYELTQQLLAFLDTVLWTHQVAFDIREDHGHWRAVRVPKGDSKYLSLAGFFSQCGQWMDLYWPAYAYSADLQLFFDCFMQHPFARLSSCGKRTGMVDKVFAGSLYNDFVDCLRVEAVRRGVKKSLADWRGNLVDQKSSIHSYLSGSMRERTYLVPIRVDFNYEEYAFDGSGAMPRMARGLVDGLWVSAPSQAPFGHGRAETRARIDTRVAMADRDRFFDNQRGSDWKLFDRMVAYVCKLEQGSARRANHFHCVFLIDAKHMSKAKIDTLKYGLGERWRRVTRGQGLMFDCHESTYKPLLKAQGKWAIDPVDCTNFSQVAALADYLVEYFAKDDAQMVRVKPTAKARTLTMGRADSSSQELMGGGLCICSRKLVPLADSSRLPAKRSSILA